MPRGPLPPATSPWYYNVAGRALRGWGWAAAIGQAADVFGVYTDLWTDDTPEGQEDAWARHLRKYAPPIKRYRTMVRPLVPWVPAQPGQPGGLNMGDWTLLCTVSTPCHWPTDGRSPVNHQTDAWFSTPSCVSWCDQGLGAPNYPHDVGSGYNHVILSRVQNWMGIGWWGASHQTWYRGTSTWNPTVQEETEERPAIWRRGVGTPLPSMFPDLLPILQPAPATQPKPWPHMLPEPGFEPSLEPDLRPRPATDHPTRPAFVPNMPTMPFPATIVPPFVPGTGIPLQPPVIRVEPGPGEAPVVTTPPGQPPITNSPPPPWYQGAED